MIAPLQPAQRAQRALNNRNAGSTDRERDFQAREQRISSTMENLLSRYGLSSEVAPAESSQRSQLPMVAELGLPDRATAMATAQVG